jgi:hypothetical protein
MELNVSFYCMHMNMNIDLQCHESLHENKARKARTLHSFQCSHKSCASTFKYKNCYRRHMQSRHKQDVIMCPRKNCTAQLHSESELKNHLTDVHRSKFVCVEPNCNRFFRRTDTLFTHVEKHEKNKIAMYGFIDEPLDLDLTTFFAE